MLGRIPVQHGMAAGKEARGGRRLRPTASGGSVCDAKSVEIIGTTSREIAALVGQDLLPADNLVAVDQARVAGPVDVSRRSLLVFLFHVGHSLTKPTEKERVRDNRVKNLRRH